MFPNRAIIGALSFGSAGRAAIHGIRPADPEGLEVGLGAMTSAARGLSGGRRCTAFEFVGTQVPQRGMPTPRVVPEFQELKDGHTRFGLGAAATRCWRSWPVSTEPLTWAAADPAFNRPGRRRGGTGNRPDWCGRGRVCRRRGRGPRTAPALPRDPALPARA